MSINWKATKSKFDEMYNQRAIARGLGVSTVLFCQVLNGKYPFMHAAGARKVVARLRDLQVLVEDGGSDGDLDHSAAA
jgi:hypothetical protein